MPFAKITEDLPRRATAMDINRAPGNRGPNSGTVWAGTEPDPNAISEPGDPCTPNRFNAFSTPETPKGDPRFRPVQQVLDTRQSFDCKVCNLNFSTMETFNTHCVPVPSEEGGDGKMMRCELNRKKFDESNPEQRGHMMDESSVTKAVVDALTPTLLSIANAFTAINATLENMARGQALKPAKAKKEGKKRGRPKMVRRGAAPDRAESPREVAPDSGTVADPSPKPEEAAPEA
jgi:hypothetical protein